MTISASYVHVKTAFELTPIILTRGIATSWGGALPIIMLTQGVNILRSLLATGPSIELNNFFAAYKIMSGATMIQSQVASYPFANQGVAANAIIAQPLNVSVQMICPAGPNTGGFQLRLVTMIALQNSLAQHNNSGGTYSIVTPSYIYTDCIMTSMRDISGGEDKQQQYAWQLDFVQPLVTQQAAQTALNGAMQKISDGTAPSGTPSWTYTGLAIGNPVGLLSSSLVPQKELQPEQ